MQAILTIIIPVYNEEDNIKKLEVVLEKYMKSANVPTRVLFVNDGSTDKSQDLIEQVCKKTPFFSFIELEKNSGLSAALKAGFDIINTKFIGYMDADLQTNPEDFNLLLDHIDDYDLITGVRYSRKDSLLKKVSSRIANSIRRVFTHDGMDDTGCPLKIIRSSFAKRIPMFSGLHRFLPAMILLQNGRVKQVAVEHYPRVAGQSKYGLLNRILGPLIDCFVYLWMKRRYINYHVKKVK